MRCEIVSEVEGSQSGRSSGVACVSFEYGVREKVRAGTRVDGRWQWRSAQRQGRKEQRPNYVLKNGEDTNEDCSQLVQKSYAALYKNKLFVAAI